MQARARTSGPHMSANCIEWMRFARWLDQHHITRLGACTEADWRAYAEERLGQLSRDSAAIICARLTDLWAYDQLTARPAGISRPPWETEGVDGFLPALDTAGSGENATEPLDPLVLGPLLIWAIRFVDDFADDILAAWAERRRLADVAAANTATPATLAALEDRLLPLAQSGAPLPASPVRGATSIARLYVAALTGASIPQTARFAQRHGLSQLAVQRPGPCPLQIPVTGRINGRPWRAHLDFYEAAELMRHLGTATAIVCLYLTGMRPQEVQGLRSGCCPDPDLGPGAAATRDTI
ncbi:hypothetical protein [Streptomyces paradoxus]|uniref:hypothetical protein n=1 Tax=Streptomyces paradoxus TaxID=66375 RepID=UPI00381CD2EF